MCTISWLYFANAYHVFFNRDEQRTRPLALPPEVYTVEGINVVMPQDPQGGGSWVAVNEFGFSFALLNYYQGRLPKGRLVSRGQIIKRLSSCRSIAQTEASINGLLLQKYAPFSLLLFSPATEGDSAAPHIWRWTGKAMERGLVESPLISSAKFFDEVVAARQKRYQQAIFAKPSVTVDDFYRLHSSHCGEPSAFGFCIHRPDACTVSFSHIAVNSEVSNFRYQPGSPCDNHPVQDVLLRRAQ